MIVTISIIVIVTTLGIVSYKRAEQNANLESAISQFITDARGQKNKAVNGVGGGAVETVVGGPELEPNGHALSFDLDQSKSEYSLYIEELGGQLSNTVNKSFSDEIEIFLPNGGNQRPAIRFNQHTGNLNIDGTDAVSDFEIGFQVKNNTSLFNGITISPIGAISIWFP